MRPLLTIAMIGFGLAFPVAADGPLHINRTLGPFEFDSPAGETCNFNYHEEYILTQNIKRFFDADGNVVRAVRNEEVWVLHQNADTGQTLTEVDHYTVNVDWVTGFVANSGQSWHLRDEDGRLVYAGAGRYTMDAYTGEILSETPNMDFPSEFAQVICTALGGAPAL